MQKIAIYGAGGFGRETKLLIQQINAQSEQWDFIGFFDDGESVNSTHGGMEALNAYPEFLNIVIAIADSKLRKTIVNRVTNKNVSFAKLIHPSVILDRSVNIGVGSIITANCVLTTNISIGNHNIINLSSTLGHDISTGNFCSIMPGTHLSGNVSIGEGVLIGTGARILQNLEIGDWSKIGAGAVVINNVEEETTVVGVPAKPVIR